MKIFIMYVSKLTDSYHSGGGLIVIAKDMNRAKEIIDTYEDTNPTEDEWNFADIYDLHEDHNEEQVYIFPDAGCC